MHATYPLLKKTDFPPIRRKVLDTLQVNLGYKCNQTCVHCHVNAGPNRTEMMDAETIELILQVIEKRNIKILDVTGGAPELNTHFRYLVTKTRRFGAIFGRSKS
jgi:MoaA/NifB/PqqE/SkfB family radical SAM enzyme